MRKITDAHENKAPAFPLFQGTINESRGDQSLQRGDTILSTGGAFLTFSKRLLSLQPPLLPCRKNRELQKKGSYISALSGHNKWEQRWSKFAERWHNTIYGWHLPYFLEQAALPPATSLRLRKKQNHAEKRKQHWCELAPTINESRGDWSVQWGDTVLSTDSAFLTFSKRLLSLQPPLLACGKNRELQKKGSYISALSGHNKWEQRWSKFAERWHNTIYR